MTRKLTYSLAILAMAFFVGQGWLLLAQSAPAAGGREAKRLLGLHQTRGFSLSSHSATHETATPATYSDAVALGLAETKVYQFRSVDYPGAASSFVQDYNEKVAVGDCECTNGELGFSHCRGSISPADAGRVTGL
jgi:hypothetical protein